MVYPKNLNKNEKHKINPIEEKNVIQKQEKIKKRKGFHRVSTNFGKNKISEYKRMRTSKRTV